MRLHPFNDERAFIRFFGLTATLYVVLSIWIFLGEFQNIDRDYQSAMREPLPPVQTGITYHPLKAWCEPR